MRECVASYKLISFLRDANILSACIELGFDIEIDIALANSLFKSDSDLMLEHSVRTSNFSSFCTSSVINVTLKSLSVNDFANRAILFLLDKAKMHPLSSHIGS